MHNLETRLRSQLEQRALAVTPGPAPQGLHRAVRRRRRQRIAVTAASAVLAIAASVTAVVLVGTIVPSPPHPSDPVLAPWTSETEDLPAASLTARRDVSGAWTGSEFLVWGGSVGEEPTGTYFADGAAYNPETGAWRVLPPSPLTARAGQQAAWTGTEMIIWGGEDSHRGAQGMVDGQAFNPTTGRWRAIAPAPGEGRSYAKTLTVAGSVVTVGGTSSKHLAAARTVLVYDPARDRWDTYNLPFRAYDAVAVGDAIALAGVDDANRVRLAYLTLDASAPLSMVDVPVSFVVRQLSLALDDRSLVLAVSEEGVEHTRLLVGALGADGRPVSWSGRDVASSVRPTYSLLTGDRGITAIVAPHTLLLALVPEVSIVNIATGRVLLQGTIGKRGRSCGVTGAHAWTGTALFIWGGVTCPDSSVSANGVRWTPSP